MLQNRRNGRLQPLPPTNSQLHTRYSLWNRPASPVSFHLQARDIEILRSIFLHRFLKPRHIQAVLGGSIFNLARRCRLLWQHRFLERPLAQRPLRLLTDEMVYGLGKKGASLLAQQYPELRIASLDWTESPAKQIGWPYIDHQLGIATFMVSLAKATQVASTTLKWDGHSNRRQHHLRLGNGGHLQPDAYFQIVLKSGKVIHNCLEYDRQSVSLSRMKRRYGTYCNWWKEKMAETVRQVASKSRSSIRLAPGEAFRVLTVTVREQHMNSLRRIAQSIGRDRNHQNSWKGLMFTHSTAYSLDAPNQILDPIFRYADDERTITLIPRRNQLDQL